MSIAIEKSRTPGVPHALSSARRTLAVYAAEYRQAMALAVRAERLSHDLSKAASLLKQEAGKPR